MVKPEWGAKRACPKCGTRFYDLGKADPATCISCGNAWVPESILKSKQPLPFEERKVPEGIAVVADADLGDDLDIDEADSGVEEDVDLGDDDDLGVEAPTADDDV